MLPASDSWKNGSLAAAEASREDDLDRAIERARTALVSRQRDDGSWNTDTDIGPIGMATQLLTEALFGALPAGDHAPALAYFESRQQDDGAFPPHPQDRARPVGARKNAGMSYQSMTSVVVDPQSGDIYIGGLFHDTIDIGGGLWTSSGGADAFIARLDADGEYVWGRPMIGADDDYTFGIAIDGLSRVLAGGSADAELASPGVSTDVAVIGYALEVNGLEPLANGGLMISGYWGNTLGTDRIPVPSSGAEDGMVVELDSDLDPISTLIIGSTGYDDVSHVILADATHPFAIATFREPITLPGCDAMPPLGDADALLLRLAP